MGKASPLAFVGNLSDTRFTKNTTGNSKPLAECTVIMLTAFNSSISTESTKGDSPI